MPRPFDNCREQGGKIRTKSLKGGKYIHICWLKGTSYPGEIKTKKNIKK